MQRLYLQFYVTILIVLAMFVGAAVLLWRVADDDNRTPQYLDVAAELTGALLHEANAPRPEKQRAITALQRKLSQEADDKLLAELKAKGVQVTTPDKSAFAKATADVDDKWMAGPIGPYVKKVVAAARTQ